MTAILELFDLSKKYGDTVILDGINLRIEQPSMIAIVGPSGSGKTTLLNMIGMLDKPDSGHINIRNTNINQLSEGKQNNLRNQVLGFGFQQAFLIRYLNVLENVALPLTIKGISNKQAFASALKLLQKVGMQDFAHHRPHQLSSGQRQRVAICRAIINNPSILLLDEPSGNLDADNSDHLIRLIADLTQQSDIVVLISTHDTKMIEQADTVYGISGGKLVQTP